MEVVEGQGRQKVEEYLDGLLDPERIKGVAIGLAIVRREFHCQLTLRN